VIVVVSMEEKRVAWGENGDDDRDEEKKRQEATIRVENTEIARQSKT
jgi:hypothetical protein